jgi:hypothetical protein
MKIYLLAPRCREGYVVPDPDARKKKLLRFFHPSPMTDTPLAIINTPSTSKANNLNLPVEPLCYLAQPGNAIINTKGRANLCRPVVE